jgi:hypothetical protein
MNSCPIIYIFRPICIKFGTDLHEEVPYGCEFRESRHTVSCTLVRVVNEFLSALSTFIVQPG